MILWFSGTGNSRYVAEKISVRLGETLREMTPDILSQPLHIAPDTERIIWVFPVYSWGIPPYVRNILDKIHFDSLPASLPHHLVITCGDDAGLTADSWRKAIRNREWHAASAYSVQMPNNYVAMKGFDIDSPQVEKEKLDLAPLRINEVINGILKTEKSGISESDTVKGKFAWIKSRIIYPWFIRYAMSPKPFHHTSACISCGKCAQICPLDNVQMTKKGANQGQIKKSYPSWGNHCAGCLACYHVCPKHAVEYGNKTKSKGQYLNPLIYMNKN